MFMLQTRVPYHGYAYYGYTTLAALGIYTYYGCTNHRRCKRSSSRSCRAT